jgi:hypothetical protein
MTKFGQEIEQTSLLISTGKESATPCHQMATVEVGAHIGHI